MSKVFERLPIALAWAFVVAFVAAPLVVMFGETVWTSDGLDVSAYGQILADELDRKQLRYSIELGLVACAVALLCGFGHAWLTERTDLPGARVLGPLGVAPLVLPPILIAMGWADFADVAGFWPCAMLLGVAYAPFVAVMTARGMRSIDGRAYEAAQVARGRSAAERLLARMIAPEVVAGLLFVWIFVLSDHGVPEFLTVKGKTWHTYAEGIFARWVRRATSSTHNELVAPVVAALPLAAILVLALLVALRLRARRTIHGDFRELPMRRLGRWRWPALALPIVYLGVGVVVPVVIMFRWAAGSTVKSVPMSLEAFRSNFQLALNEASDDLTYTVGIGIACTVVLCCVALPLARQSARGRAWIDVLCVVPIAVPAILLAIGFVKVYNHPAWTWIYTGTGGKFRGFGDFYDSPGIVVAAYAARFLPFAVLPLSQAIRRVSPELEEAARFADRGPIARTLHVRLPLLLPAIWSSACLIFILALRELDVAVVLPSGNGTVVRRLSNIVHFGGEDMGGALALMLLLAAVLAPLLTWVLTGKRLRSLS